MSNVLVYIKLNNGCISDVSAQLLLKGRSLASESGGMLFAFTAGFRLDAEALLKEASFYGADNLFLFEGKCFELFREDVYVQACILCIKKAKPDIVLFESSPETKSMSAGAAAVLKTGLTADCTDLKISSEVFLLQSRPAFGGNLLADIITPECRPQMATVQAGIYNGAGNFKKRAKLIRINTIIDSKIEILNEVPLPKRNPLKDADIILALGGGVRKKEDMGFFENCAQKMNAVLAGSRVLVQRGYIGPERQIGLSGNTPSPGILICCGISGSVQFCAGIKQAQKIIAINTDENAPIFAQANIYFVGDMYSVLDKLSDRLQKRG